MSYRCDTCNYETNRSTNYNRHLLSRKHKDNVNSLSLLNEPTQNSKSIPNEPSQLLNEPSQNEQEPDMYNTVYTAVKDIEPEMSKKSKIDNTLQIIGDSAKNLQKASDEIVKNVNISKIKKGIKKDANELENDVNTIDGKKKNDMVIVAVAIIVSIVIVWILFKDKIMEFLDGNKGFNPANMDNTKIEWV